MQDMSAGIIKVVSILRGIAKAVPKASPIVMEINERIRELQNMVMSEQQPGESQAPPT
jgi:hypothetical protein